MTRKRGKKIPEQYLMISPELQAGLRQVILALTNSVSRRIKTGREPHQYVEIVELQDIERGLIMELGIALIAIMDGHDARVVFRQHRRKSLIDAHMRAAWIYWAYRAKLPKEKDLKAIELVKRTVVELKDRSPIYIRKLAQIHQEFALKKLSYLGSRSDNTRALREYLAKKRARPIMDGTV